MSLSVVFTGELSHSLSFAYHQNDSFILPSYITDGCTVFICEYTVSLLPPPPLPSYFISNMCLKDFFFFYFSNLVFLNSVCRDNWTVYKCKGANMSLKVNASKSRAIVQDGPSCGCHIMLAFVQLQYSLFCRLVERINVWVTVLFRF